MITTVLVTGANGLLATNIIIQLLNKGYRVKGLLRKASNYRGITSPHLELIEGNVTSPESIHLAMERCDHVIHVAAITAQNLLSLQSYRNVNVTGTKLLLKTAKKHQVKKFIYVSTANAFGHGSLLQPGHENLPPRPPFTNSYYALSKIEGQHLALSYKNEMKIMVVNPTFMIGPYDGKPGSGKIILLGVHKRIIFYPPGGKNFIHVKNAAQGVVQAMETGRNGESYLLAGHNMSYHEFFKQLVAVTQQKSLLIKIPRWLLKLLGVFGSFIQLFGISTSLSYNNMNILCVNNFYSSKKAADELNLKIDPVKEAIRESIDWFIQNDMIKK